MQIVHGTGHNRFILDPTGKGRHRISNGAIIMLRSKENVTISIKQLPDDEVLRIPLLDEIEEDFSARLTMTHAF